MHDFGVVLLHHRVDSCTSAHLRRARDVGGADLIIPVSQHGETFDGGYNTRDLEKQGWRAYQMRWNEYGGRYWLLNGNSTRRRAFTWRNADMALYQWYSAHKEQAERWILLEWDVLCNEPLRDFYSEVWDSDFAAANVKTPQSDPAWPHWPDAMRALPDEYKAYATGVTPLAGLFLSDRALAAITETIRNDPRLRSVFCEARVATVARKLGFTPVEISARAKVTLHDDLVRLAADIAVEPGIWHKVKDHVMDGTPACFTGAKG